MKDEWIDGLIVKENWGELILSGEKTIELRGSNTHKRGIIAIIYSGSPFVRGFVKIVDSKEIETEKQYERLRSKHQVGANKMSIKYKRLFGWWMEQELKLKKPIEYIPKLGQQIWVKHVITNSEYERIIKQEVNS